MWGSIARNASSLYVAQIAQYLLHFITVPCVVRVLGPVGFGTVAFAHG